MGDVTIAVATFGDKSWIELAQRAIRSAHDQAPVIHVHGDTLADARNRCLAQVDTEFIVYLDADDELTDGYVPALLTGTADLRAPAVEFIRNGRARAPFVPNVYRHNHACSGDCLPQGNWLVIGTMARAQILRDVGGWEEWPVYEDWALWWRCQRAGATIEAVPAAVYRAYHRPDSRNHAGSQRGRDQWHHEITRSVLADAA